MQGAASRKAFSMRRSSVFMKLKKTKLIGSERVKGARMMSVMEIQVVVGSHEKL